MSRKYARSASKDVETEMHEFKRGKLKSGSGKKVTSRKQAIAIGLSIARKKGKRVPVAPKAKTKPKTKAKSTTRGAVRKSSTRKKAA